MKLRSCAGQGENRVMECTRATACANSDGCGSMRSLRSSREHRGEARLHVGLKRFLRFVIRVPQLDHGRALLQHRQELAVAIPSKLQAPPVNEACLVIKAFVMAGSHSFAAITVDPQTNTNDRRYACPVPSSGISKCASPCRLKIFTTRFCPHVARNVPCGCQAKTTDPCEWSCERRVNSFFCTRHAETRQKHQDGCDHRSIRTMVFVGLSDEAHHALKGQLVLSLPVLLYSKYSTYYRTVL